MTGNFEPNSELNDAKPEWFAALAFLAIVTVSAAIRLVSAWFARLTMWRRPK